MMAATIKTTGEQIKEARLAKGISQRQIETDLGWGGGMLSVYERDKCAIPKEREEELYSYLGLGTEKVEDFFRFKETKTPEPVEPVGPDKHGPNKNHEGYADPTMAAALKNAMVKYNDHLPGEIWLHKRNNGSVIQKLILSINGRLACCVSVFSNGSQYDVGIKTKSNQKRFVNIDKVERIPLKELEERKDVLNDVQFEKVQKEILNLLDIPPVEKEVIKEVPVEKVVEKEVIKEVPVEVEKEVIKEVPVEVEKEVIKEVPVEVEKEVVKEVPVEVEKEVIKEVPVCDPLELAKMEAKIYKEAFTMVCECFGKGGTR